MDLSLSITMYNPRMTNTLGLDEPSIHCFRHFVIIHENQYLITSKVTFIFNICAREQYVVTQVCLVSEFLDDTAINAFNKYSKFNMTVANSLFLEFHGPAQGLDNQFDTVSK